MARATGETRILEEVGFVHLHVHSSFSLLEGAIMIANLAKMAATDKQPALALTDTNNLFGALEFSEKMAGSGIQPIIGVQLSVDFGDDEGQARRVTAQPHPHIVLLAMSETGYGNLMKLVSRAALASDTAHGQHIAWSEVALRHDGLIALTGGQGGPLDAALRQGQPVLAEGRLDQLQALFGDRLYVELQRHGEEAGSAIENQLLAMAY
ncbi:MAG: PHP domain-containing protein, partial [Bosea sp. (in: a-proteobacteria)]